MNGTFNKEMVKADIERSTDAKQVFCQIRTEVTENMLNSAEHECFSTHKC